MSCFNILCEVLERLDDDTYNALMEEKSSRIIPALSEITADGLSGVQIYVDFVICAVAADGKLTEAEYQLIKPILDLSMEADVGYGDAQKFFYDNGLDRDTRTQWIPSPTSSDSSPRSSRTTSSSCACWSAPLTARCRTRSASGYSSLSSDPEPSHL